MPRTVNAATHRTPRPASRHLLAYLEEGRVRVFDARRQNLWIALQLPETEELRIKARLRELNRTGRRTDLVEIQLLGDEEMCSVSVLCVRA